MYNLIVCGVFEKEIEAIREDLGFPFKARYLGPGLHVDFDELRTALDQELKKASQSGSEGTIVIYGQCHPQIDDILKPYPATLVDCQSCVDAFITRKVMEEKAKRVFSSIFPPAGWMPGEIYSIGWAGMQKRLACIWAHSKDRFISIL